MIAIQSNKNLKFFPSYTGKITMVMDLIQNKPEQKVYEMRIIDSCKKVIQKEFPLIGEDGLPTGETEMKNVDEIQGKTITRFKLMSYDELDQLAIKLNVDMSDKTKLRENINELFRQGLLAITQKECIEEQGIYFSEAQDWEIVRQ